MTASLRSALLIALVSLILHTGRAAAQAPADTGWRRLATGMYGEVAVVIQRRPDGRIEVSAADDRRRGVGAFAPQALARWADTTAKLVVRREKAGKSDRVLRSAIEEPGVVAGAMALTRRVATSGSTFSLFFADTSFGGFSVPLDDDEARVFVASVRKAAQKTLASDRGAPGGKKKARAKAKESDA